MIVPEGLKRYPPRPRELLQAWDGADELMLAHVAEGGVEALWGRRILVLNDSFGALGCALEARGLDVTVYSDSYLSGEGIRINSEDRIKPLSDLSGLRGPYDLLLARIPKNLSFFEDQLEHASRHLRPGAAVVCGYMVKHQANASFEILGRLIGETRTSLARKKARLILAEHVRGPVASTYPRSVEIEGFDRPFVHHSNLFSREKLDIGTRFLLEHLPEGPHGVILDLGCANGIVGVAAKLACPEARVVFTDESRMAVESARANYGRFFPAAAGAAAFHWTDGARGVEAESVDLVLCNPPFHQGTRVDDWAARRMFEDARRVLRPGGMLRVIGNTHLGYPATLRRLFGESEIVAANAKFTIVDVVRVG